MVTRQQMSRPGYSGSLLALENDPRFGYIPTAVQSASGYTAAAGQLVLMNAASGNLSVTIPASGIHGALVGIKKIDLTTNTVTVAAGGTSLEYSGTTTFVLSQPGATVVFEYDNNNGLWRVVNADSPVGAVAGSSIPTGGTTGQVLAKTSNTDYATAWTTASTSSGSSGGPVPKLVAGSYGDNRLTSTATYASLFATASYCYYTPIYVPAACTINQLLVNMTTGNSTAVATSIAMLSSTSTGAPGTLLAAPVTLSVAASVGTLAATYSASVPAGWNWVGWGWPAGTQGSTYNITALPANIVATPIVGTAVSAFAGGLNFVTVIGATTPVSNPAGTSYFAAGIPLVGYRVVSVP